MSTESGGMHIELLGPLSVRMNQVPVVPAAAKPRQALALLTLNAGRVVTVSTLIEELWGDRPPPSAHTTLQTYIFDLRKRLATAMGPGKDPKWVLRTAHVGYLLDAQSGQIDIDEFDRLAEAGRTAAEGANYRGSAELLGRALALWRGPALVDVRKGRVLELEAMALEESRLAVLSRRIDADLALGRHADILGELTALAARHPLDENFSAQLITALYRTGHTARALQAFRRLRSSLVDELGIEPSVQLQRLQQAMLSRDPSIESAVQRRLAPHDWRYRPRTRIQARGIRSGATRRKPTQIDMSIRNAVQEDAYFQPPEGRRAAVGRPPFPWLFTAMYRIYGHSLPEESGALIRYPSK